MEPNTSMRQRIYREVEQLEEEYAITKLQIIKTNEPTQQNTSIHIILYDPHNKNYPKNIKFILTTHYPFHPPKILIKQNETYIDWLKTIIPHSSLPRITKYLALTPKNKTECIYCNYINNTWSPASRLVKILTQIEEVKVIKREIKYRLSLERISQKYPHPEEIAEIILTYIL